MLNNILNLEGVTVLDKKTQSRMNGGQTCIVTTTLSNGFTLSAFVNGFSSGSTGSSEANSHCLGIISDHPGARCGYDCEYDGYGI